MNEKNKKQSRMEKPLSTSGDQKKLDLTTEKHQVLKAMIREVITKELGKLESDVFREVNQTSQQIERLVLQVIPNQEQSNQYEQSMLKGQEKSDSKAIRSGLAKIRSLFASKK